MSVLKIITKPVETKTSEVIHQGATYSLAWKPDPNLYSDLFLRRPDQLESDAHSLSVLSGAKVDGDTISHIRLVARLLVHEDDPESRYPEHEIAQLAARDPLLFGKLLGAADALIGGSVVDEVAAGESEASDAPSTSKERASGQPESQANGS
jgi:hypothetical protein